MLPYVEWRALARRRARSSSPTTRHRRRAARGEGRGRGGEAPARRRRIADRGLEALTAETWVGRSRARARLAAARALARARRRRARRSTRSSPRARTVRCRTRTRRDTIVERGTLVTVDWGVRVDGYCCDCTRTFSTGELPDQLREAYDVCLEAQVRACASIKAGHDRRRGRRARARPDHRRRASATKFGHGLGHGVGAGGPRGAAPLDRVDRHARGRATASRSSRGST